nr:uncharacterized protein LOC123774863 isoform X1 [Procambarus clarkii]
MWSIYFHFTASLSVFFFRRRCVSGRQPFTMLPSTRVSMFVMFWLLTEGWCSQPTHSSAGNSLMSLHADMTTDSVPTPLPPRVSQLPVSQEDASGAHGALNHFKVAGRSDVGDDHTLIFVKDSEIKTPVTQEEPSRYDHDADEALANNTQLNMPIMGVSEDSVVRAVATNNKTVDDIMMRTSVLNVSSDPHQKHIRINRTSGNIHPLMNMTLASHAQDDEELVNSDHMIGNTNTNILRRNSAHVRSQKPVQSVPAKNTNNVTVKRYRRVPLHDDVPVNKESFLLQSDGQKTMLESNSRKHENSTIVEDISKETRVRKCFGINEFFNFKTRRRETLEDNTAFTILVRSLLEKNVNTDLRIVPLIMGQCQDPGDEKKREPIDFTSHSILPFGYLRDLKSKLNYDQDHYCLEMEAPDAENISSGILSKIFCPLRPIEVSTRKCCGVNEYFNLTDKHCHPRSSNVSEYNDLVQEFTRNYPGVTSIHWNTSKLICRHGEPRRVSTDQAFLDSSNQLCERQSGQCYPSSLYCIEYSWGEGTPAMVAEASICPVDSFYKCCPRGHILTKSGCISASREDVSPYMLQLLEEMEPKFGIPARTNDCHCVEKLINVSDSNIHWWKSMPQYPPVDIKAKNSSAIRYCVDDYRGPDNHTVTVAIVCYTEVGNVRKCCPCGQYMENGTCVSDSLGLSLLHDPLLSAANLTKLTDNSFPTCETENGYHVYYMGRRSSEDYGEMIDNQELQLVNMDAGCRLNNKTIKRENYCLEYFGNATVQHLKVMMCVRSSMDMGVNSENLWAKAVLLTLSCVALLATTLYLLPQKVNKGYSVRKVKMLAGRLQLSYVLTSLVGFLLLAVNMVVPIYQDSLACYIMSGLLTFFLLAGFQWNTSICLEALLITLSFRMFGEDEGWRYILHSLWAWGVPGLITSLALTLNHYRASLPCSVITPRIGLKNCFFSDQKAKLVYLYVPMLLTLCANTFLLVASRCVRSANLRRMEKG